MREHKLKQKLADARAALADTRERIKNSEKRLDMIADMLRMQMETEAQLVDVVTILERKLEDAR